jgi:hypothetical protein
MHNESHTKGEEQVSQDTLEAILKLAQLGDSPEAISSVLDLNVQTVIQIVTNDPVLRAREVKSIKEVSGVQVHTVQKTDGLAHDGL